MRQPAHNCLVESSWLCARHEHRAECSRQLHWLPELDTHNHINKQARSMLHGDRAADNSVTTLYPYSCKGPPSSVVRLAVCTFHPPCCFLQSHNADPTLRLCTGAAARYYPDPDSEQGWNTCLKQLSTIHRNRACTACSVQLRCCPIPKQHRKLSSAVKQRLAPTHTVRLRSCKAKPGSIVCRLMPSLKSEDMMVVPARQDHWWQQPLLLLFC